MQRKQLLVKLTNKNEGDEFINYLLDEGFKNIHNITFDNLRIKVIVVDSNVFFSPNATCLAGLSSCGIKPISVCKFKEIYEATNADNLTL
jgi:hypothetical protein